MKTSLRRTIIIYEDQSDQLNLIFNLLSKSDTLVLKGTGIGRCTSQHENI